MKLVVNILNFVAVFVLCACSSVQSRYHRVEDGDSLASIAQKYDVPVNELRAHNSDRLSRGLKSGTKLYIPFEESEAWDDELVFEMRDRRRPASVPELGEIASANFNWPVSGPITSQFGKRKSRNHDGIDIAAKTGVQVKSARSGHVIYAGNRIRGYGNLVIIKHADTFSTVYAHLSRIHVKKGQFVARGQLIGKVGRTGRASGSHLHFEVRNDRVPVDPLLYLHTQYAANRIHTR